tara:strand:- start:3215 stop:4885 length:1671 start_codon:yes stop_codon:yes gene_type:complete
MCGIFAYISCNIIKEDLLQKINIEGMKCKKRGPDNTVTKMVDNNKFLMFHRLKINDMSEQGNQPIVHPDDFNITLICNGEIYNWKELADANNFNTKSTSDCEIIVHMYKKYGIEETIQKLDGVFAFVLIDKNKNIIHAARDPIGVRSFYIGTSKDSLVLASECKNLDNLSESIIQFKPGSFISIDFNKLPKNISDIVFNDYYKLMLNKQNWRLNSDINEKTILKKIRDKLDSAIEKRLLSDRPIGCLLSGGLDSSLITALVAKKLNRRIKTFSVGLEGSVDLDCAQKVANYVGTDHFQLKLSIDEMFNSIPEVIKEIETYDITTIRASTPMYLLSKYIKENTDITVLFSGEGSDEASGSYLYFHNAPNENDFDSEIERLMTDLSYFDVLRCDKSTASAGLEVRVPFLDKAFLEYYLGIHPKFKIPKNYKIEKYLLRKTYDDNLLPDDILWRTKEGMSDGVSSQTKAWYEIIQDKIDTLISDEEFLNNAKKFAHNTPLSKESYYYRKIFESNLTNRSSIIPYFWMPKWSGEVNDPSARVLNVYNSQDNNEEITQSLC